MVLLITERSTFESLFWAWNRGKRTIGTSRSHNFIFPIFLLHPSSPCMFGARKFLFTALPLTFLWFGMLWWISIFHFQILYIKCTKSWAPNYIIVNLMKQSGKLELVLPQKWSIHWLLHGYVIPLQLLQ